MDYLNEIFWGLIAIISIAHLIIKIKANTALQASLTSLQGAVAQVETTMRMLTQSVEKEGNDITSAIGKVATDESKAHEEGNQKLLDAINETRAELINTLNEVTKLD